MGFYLMDSDWAVVATPLVGLPYKYKVYGYSNGNILALNVPLGGADGGPEYSYSSVTGILVLHDSAPQVEFDIGPNYDEDFFELVTHSEVVFEEPQLNAVRYSVPIPIHELPEQCQIECKPIPVAPGIEPNEYTTRVTTTEMEEAMTYTRSGIIRHTTDPEGSWYTEMSYYPDEETTHSSTWTVTDGMVDSTYR
ncbi:Cell wall protein RBR3 [Candida viswanathii]|uniref:Cell wall protein RBR3 n=1 Tax=Candida viswanathii TaxID=5486 RepID=A0A367YCC2_9ASCO|nr:Cell wall protein RBR3 [Candida viswanathii]